MTPPVGELELEEMRRVVLDLSQVIAFPYCAVVSDEIGKDRHTDDDVEESNDVGIR
jgi:hypothetical protein